ncbi:MAG: hypothetical protein LBP41_02880 [Holosporaceae bacterium]|jgi:hypothetical protein|nr:hypothetical protein [Holosporaceae bacterium]
MHIGRYITAELEDWKNPEEMFTILGPTDEKYLEGDDLFENVYRCFNDLPMRWLHNKDSKKRKSEISNGMLLAHTTAYQCAEFYKRQNSVWSWIIGLGILGNSPFLRKSFIVGEDTIVDKRRPNRYH